MDKKEIKDKFDMLYGMMSVSSDTRQMKLFGDVMKQMMSWFVENKPEAAEMFVETLCAIKWEQYLSKSEAEKVVSEMKPPAAWDYATWHKAMTDLGLETEREYVFNCYALWVQMNATHSDNGKLIAELMGMSSLNATDAEYIKAIHRFAVNMLTDEDKKFSIRSYYLGE